MAGLMRVGAGRMANWMPVAAGAVGGCVVGMVLMGAIVTVGLFYAVGAALELAHMKWR